MGSTAFQYSPAYTFGESSEGSSYPAAIVDINGDKTLDLVVNSYDYAVDEASIIFVFNDGNGNLTPSVAPIKGEFEDASADFNKDGHLDIVIEAGSYPNYQTIVYLADGAGGFTKSEPIDGHPKYSTDYDKDGNQDIVLYDGTYKSFVWYGDGTGGFTKAEELLGDDKHDDDRESAFDFDNNGQIDAINYSYESDKTYIRLSDGVEYKQSAELEGNLTYLRSSYLAAGVTDLNDDGILDVVTDVDTYDPDTREQITITNIWIGEGDGTFAKTQAVEGRTIGTADFNSDGVLDLVIEAMSETTSLTKVLLGDKSGSYAETTSLDGYPLMWYADLYGEINDSDYGMVIDLNNDGNLDLFTQTGRLKEIRRRDDVLYKGSEETEPEMIKVWLGDGTGKFTLNQLLAGANMEGGISILGDLNSDGVLEVITYDFLEREGGKGYIWLSKMESKQDVQLEPKPEPKQELKPSLDSDITPQYDPKPPIEDKPDFKVTRKDDFFEGSDLNDRVNGKSGDDELRGYEGKDKLSGGKGDDLLEGGDDKDILKGNTGKDVIMGGEGDDIIIGGAGRDKMFGGEGADTFVYKSFRHGGDKIADFNPDEDMISLRGKKFGNMPKGILDEGMFVLGSKPKDGDDHFIFNSKGWLIYDANGDGQGRSKKLVKLTGNIDITHANIEFF